MKTQLTKRYTVTNEGDARPTRIHDSWEIPDGGTEIWCTAWKRGQVIRPYGDGAHVIVGLTVYHCDAFMKILLRNEKNGYTWGIDATMTREQLINGQWQKVAL